MKDALARRGWDAGKISKYQRGGGGMNSYSQRRRSNERLEFTKYFFFGIERGRERGKIGQSILEYGANRSEKKNGDRQTWLRG